MDQPSKKDRKPQPLSIRIGEAFAQARAILEEARVPARLSDFCSIDGLFPHEDMPSLQYEDSAIEWGDSICAYFRAHESECYQAAEDYGLDHCPDEAVRRYLDREEEEDEGDEEWAEAFVFDCVHFARRDEAVDAWLAAMGVAARAMAPCAKRVQKARAKGASAASVFLDFAEAAGAAMEDLECERLWFKVELRDVEREALAREARAVKAAGRGALRI
jgi:hypothetical protein